MLHCQAEEKHILNSQGLILQNPSSFNIPCDVLQAMLVPMVINKVVWYFIILLYNPHFKFLVTYFQFNNFPCFLSVSDWFHVFVCMHAVIGLKHFHYLSLILSKCFSILKKKRKISSILPCKRKTGVFICIL